MPFNVCEGEWRVRREYTRRDDGGDAPPFNIRTELLLVFLTKSRRLPRWLMLRDIPLQTLYGSRPYESHTYSEAIYGLVTRPGSAHEDRAAAFSCRYTLLDTLQPITPGAWAALCGAVNARRLEVM